MLMEGNMEPTRKLAVVTGASTGIGLELAKLVAADDHDVLLVADEPLEQAAEQVKREGHGVETVQADLSTTEGVDQVIAAIGGRKVATLMANAGRGLGHAFVEQSWADVRKVIDTNVTGTVYLLHQLAPVMKAAGEGRILITGSIAGLMPGTFQAVYNGTKAFIDNFSEALRAELKGSGVTVTCLMPGPVETEFFKTAGMMDTSVGSSDSKSNPADVAKTGFDAMMAGDGHVVAGWKNKIQAAIANVTPAPVLAEMHRQMAAPK